MIPTLPKKPTQDVDKITASWLCRLLDCVEYAMKFPFGDGKSSYRNGSTIHSIEQSRNSSDSGSGGDTYNGYFKPVQTAANKIKIVYGFDATRSYAGKITVNYFPKEVAAAEFTITENCYIYLECQLVGSPTATGATAVILQSTTHPYSVEGTYRDLISEVLFSDSAISDFSRHNVNKNVLMAGACS
ncbi:MAG: hypothetical protein PHH77_07740 [Victivallaceae bacterium]|nr:hypothetical protein [Victivallaceae bacterium]